MIRRCIIVCMLMLKSSLVFARDDFVGDWFSCYINDSRANRALHIEKEGQIYRVLIEEGSTPNTYLGLGKYANRQLRVKGCGYYRDEPKDGCDIKNPSVNFKLKKSDLKRKYKNLDLSLKNAEWIRSTKQNEYRCRILSEQLDFDKDGWPKDF